MSFISEIGKTVTTIGNVVKKTYGPLRALEENLTANFTNGNLRYPLDVGDNNYYPHTVEFQCWIPKPTGQDFDKELKRSPMPAAIGKVNDLLARARVIPATPRVNENQQYNKRLLDFTRRADPSDLIVMYNPTASWTDTVSNSYESASITNAIGKLGLLVEAGSSITNAIKDDESLPTTAIAAAYEALVAKMGKKMGMDSEILRDVGFQSQGYALNPQFEQIYKATEMRTFQFVFKMTPRNVKEALVAENIVKRFKYHASPEYTAGGGRYIVPPSYFDIEFKYLGARNDALPRISTCVMNKIDVSHAGELEQFASYPDGRPLQITMTMEFTELETMHKALRDIGY